MFSLGGGRSWMGVGWGGEGAEKVRSLTHLLRMGEKRWGADVGQAGGREVFV